MEKTNKKQSFMEGVLVLLFAQIVVKVLGLFYRLVITNVNGFGDEGNGLYGAGYQIYTLLLAISSIGVPSAISKLVSERLAVGKNREAHDIFKAALVLFGTIGMTGTILLFLSSGFIANNMIGNSGVEGVLKALSPAIFFVSVSAVIRGYFNGMYNMQATSKSQVLEQFFKSSFTIILVLWISFLATTNSTAIARFLGISSSNATEAMAVGANFASSLATACSFIYLLIFYNKRKKNIWKDINESTGEYSKKKKVDIMKTILKYSIPISLASIVAAINRNIDTFTVINGLKTLLTNNLFGTAEQITTEATRLYGILSGKIDMLIGLPSALNIAFATALVPTISEAMAKKDEKTAKRRVAFSLRTTILIALPCAVGMASLADPILSLLFPNAVAAEAPLVLQICTIIMIFTLINQTLGGALQGLGKVMIPAISLGCGAVIKLIMNLILIPNVGINGAPFGSILCQITATIIELTILHKSIKLDLNYNQAIIKPIIASTVMGLVAYFSNIFLASLLGRPSIATIIAIVIAIVVYFVLVLTLKILDREDFHMLPYGDKIYNFLFNRKNKNV